MSDTNFTTSDYGLANWLVFNKLTLLGTVEYPGNSRKSFVFINDDQLSDLASEWEKPQTEVSITCRQFFTAHSVVKKALKESLSVEDV